MPNAEIDLLRLIRTEGVGPVTYRRLMDRYRTADAALAALPRLAKAGGRASSPVVPDIGAVRAEIDRTAKIGGRLLFLGQPDYPPLLALLDDAPPCLAVLGDVALLSRPAVAMVGGRNASANGQRLAEKMGADLAASVVVVSGLARGIDSAAHRGALSIEGGKTVAAIAGGLDVVYPPENADLQRRIAESGALVTEAPPGTVPQARHFPRRNRLIAGLSLGVVVVEAALRSGSLITARIAQDAGREIFAVPGSPLDPRALGANDLIRQGAVLTETAEDVLSNLPTEPVRAAPTADGYGLAEAQSDWLSDAEISPDIRGQVIQLLSTDPTKVDDLVRRCQFSSSAVMAILLELELAGRVEALPGSRFALSPDVGI